MFEKQKARDVFFFMIVFSFSCRRRRRRLSLSLSRAFRCSCLGPLPAAGRRARKVGAQTGCVVTASRDFALSLFQRQVEKQRDR